MHVTLFGVVLFLHITVAIVAFVMAGMFHVGMPSLARARTVADMRPWGAILHRLEPLFPIFALLLLGLGVWLVHLGSKTADQFSFKDGWIITAITTLVVIEAIAGALLAPTAKRLMTLVAEAPDGVPSDEISQLVKSPKIWIPGHMATFGFLGVVFLMATKPSGEWAWLFPVVGVVVGIALARLQLQRLPVAAESGAVPAQRAMSDQPIAQPADS